MTKTDDCISLFEDDPDRHYKDVAEEVGCDPSTAYRAEQKFEDQHQPDTDDTATGDDGPADGRGDTGQVEERTGVQSEVRGSDGADPDEGGSADVGVDAAREQSGADGDSSGAADVRPSSGASESGGQSTETSGAATDGGSDAEFQVGASPGNKLKPAEAPTTIDAPEEMPDDLRPEDFELDEGGAGEESPAQADERSEEDAGAEVDEAMADSRSEAAQNDFLNKLESQTEYEETTSGKEASGIEVSEEVLAMMVGQPFGMASELTGFDGWELTDEEKEANAELFKQYCEEKDIDVSTGTLLALNLTTQTGGRAVAYKRWKDSQSDDEEVEEEDDEDEEESYEDGEDPIEQRAPEQSEPAEVDDSGVVTDGQGYDPTDPNTW